MQVMSKRTYAAHAIKPGDIINGVEVFDMARPALRGGFYLPMVDGSRVNVRTLDSIVEVD